MKRVRLREKGRVSSSVLVFEWKGQLVDIQTAARIAGVSDTRLTKRILDGFTVEAAMSPSGLRQRSVCRFCGEAHAPGDCYAPVQRGWGWPGWEDEDNHSKAQSLRSRQWRPRRKKQTLSAARAWILSRRTAEKQSRPRGTPKATKTSLGMPAKPA